MNEVKGKYNTAKVYTNNLESSAYGQILSFCNQEFLKDSIIAIMPDVHAGKGCTVGTTMTITDNIVPNFVGIDIGCGVLCVKLAEKRINLPKLDSIIKENVPSGRDVRKRPHRSHGRIDIYELKCRHNIKFNRDEEALGSLGNGNHFLSIEKDNEGNLYLLIHTGSRNLGKKVAEYYQDVAYKSLGGRGVSPIPYELAYLEGSNFDNYIADMKLMQQYAALNRTTIKEVILSEMKLTEVESFDTIHNYIDTDKMILRKGAVSANKNEKLVIPMNMRDGSLICIGKGNPAWNYSAPHGAGRLMSRSDAKNSFTLNEYKNQMKGIYTTCVDKSTIDECPMTYKPVEEITKYISDTVDIIERIKPIFNFKASENITKR